MKQVSGFMLILLLLACVVPDASACDCRPPSPEIAYEKSGAVFIGEFAGFATALSRGKRVSARRFKVKRQWKGNLGSTITLPYADDPGNCGDLKLTKGQDYLIYVSSWKGELIVIIDCGRSRNVKDAAEDLKYLEQLPDHLDGPPNNGMHPTADTLLLKFLQSLGAAGDAWR